MIGELNASHTGVTGGGRRRRRSSERSRRVIPVSTSCRTRRASTRSPTSTRTARPTTTSSRSPVGDFLIAVDDHELKTSENYWQLLHARAGSKFEFLVNDKPAKDGAWTVTISPRRRRRFHLQYAGGSTTAGEMVDEVEQRRDRLPAHPRDGRAVAAAVPARPRRTARRRRRSIIDQRFNGGGGIDQELLADPGPAQAIPVHDRARRSASSSRGPQNFFGPMVVMQNERSTSRRRDVPRRLPALGLGKVVGVTTMGAVIGTGSYTLLNGVGDSDAGQRRLDA